jgi:N-acetylneuraminic acid mutarotase
MDTGVWKAIKPMPTTRSGPSATCVDDKIYVIGGSSNNNNECYDPTTDTWTTKTSRDGTGTSRNVVYNNITLYKICTL